MKRMVVFFSVMFLALAQSASAQSPSITEFLGAIQGLPYWGKILHVSVMQAPLDSDLVVYGCREAVQSIAEAFSGSAVHVVEQPTLIPAWRSWKIWQVGVTELRPMEGLPPAWLPGTLFEEGYSIYEYWNPGGEQLVAQNCNSDRQSAPVPELAPDPVFSFPPIEKGDFVLQPIVVVAIAAMIILVIGAGVLVLRSW